MRCLLLMVGISAVIVSSIPARANNVTGNTMYEACTAEGEVFQSFCSAYVIGALEGLRFGASIILMQASPQDDKDTLNALTETFLGFCHLQDVEYGQYRDVFVKFLRDNPAQRHNSARSLMLDSFAEAFPCSE